MEPQRNTNATLVDLIDRVLDKGLVIHADLIVSVAGIPLIGVNLKAALAGMETMLEYGMMRQWDERGRAWKKEHRSKQEISLLQGEDVILKMLGAFYSSEGIYAAWKYGCIYLTSERLLLYHCDFRKVLFEIPLVKIRGMVVRETIHFTGKERKELYLLLEGNKIAALSALNAHQLKEAIEKRMVELEIIPDKDPALPVFEKRAAEFLTHEEQLICKGKMWYLMGAEGIAGQTWSPGHLYLTDKRLCWYYDFKQRVALEIPVDKLVAPAMEAKNLSEALPQKRVLDIVYAVNGARRLASFSCDAMEEWKQILNQIISGREELQPMKETETCPQCGGRTSIKELLERGCFRCGWVSPAKNKGIHEIKSPA